MKNLKYIVLVFILVITSCCSYNKKNMENCEIKKVLRVTNENDNLYYIHVQFSSCSSKKSRENLIKDEMRNRFPSIQNRTIHVEEYLGKMYNEYKYEVKIE